MAIIRLTPTTLQNLQADNLFYDIASLAAMTKEYRKQHPNEKHGGVFEKSVVQTILNDPNCVALRYYFGINVAETDPLSRFSNPALIICGIDASGKDLIPASGRTPQSAEKSWSCPPDCSLASPLNTD